VTALPPRFAAGAKRASQAKNSRYQSCELRGFRIQWFWSGH
jgi:hypothetical protein